MRAPFFQPLGRLDTRPLWFCLLVLLLQASWAARAADASWINTGTIDSPPQIDATNVVNYGTIDLTFANTFSTGSPTTVTTQPFETSDTQNYTNSGSMACTPGWRFDNSPSGNGQRKSSANFVNTASGTISGLDSGHVVFLNQANLSSVSPSYLWVFSTNIVSAGLLSVGANGWLKLAGTNITLRNSGLEVTAISPQGTFDIGSSNFFPDVGIHDVWWGQTNLTLNQRPLWDGITAQTPPHTVARKSGFPFTVSFSISDGIADSYVTMGVPLMITLTNQDGSTTAVSLVTNLFKQAVFVGFNDQNVSADIRYDDSPQGPNDPFKTVAVQLLVASTNVITGLPDQSQLYFYDMLASVTNRGILTNVVDGFSGKPVNYAVSRIDNGLFAGGFPGNNGFPDSTFFYTNNFNGDVLSFYTNLTALAEYAGYNVLVDNIVTEPPPIPAGTVTNLPGRIQIYGQNVDMSKTRVRGEGEVIVKANNLVSSDSAVVDCENLSYELGATNGALKFQNLAQESVLRMNGNVIAFSALWTNTLNVVFMKNYVCTSNSDGTMTCVQTPITNAVTIQFHTLMLNADELVSQKPVRVYDFITHSTNVVVNDRMILVQNLFIDGQSFTLNGSMTFSSVTFVDTIGFSHTFALADWVNTNAPNLLYFTNNGTLTLPGSQQAGTAHFGDDRPVPYVTFVNSGIVSAASINIDSASFQNDGALTTTIGPLTLAGGAGKLEAGQSSSAGDTVFQCSSAKFNRYQLSSSRGLYLDISDSLFDAGGTSGNVVSVQYGFTLARKPTTGDLLGTSFQTLAPDFAEIDHYWAGEDRGVSNAGYTNNVALAKLIIGPPGRNPTFFFAGTGAGNGLYVDLLDLSSLGTNFQSLIDIDPSLTIYFAAAKLGFTPPNNASGIPQEPEEYLNGQFGGHLRWVNSFAGPNSSVDVIINGQTVSVNRALRFSKIIDSNGDGIPNYYDPYPFNAPPLKLTASMVAANPPPTKVVAVSWTAAPNTVYQVEFTTNMPFATWQPLVKYTNAAPNSVGVTITDPSAPVGGAKRFYRVRTSN